MMSKILEYVPNLSKERDLEEVEKIVSSFRGREDVKLLDYSTDKDHNRCVVIVVGELETVRDTVTKTTGVTTELIDMTRHEGQHPRMGAIDIVPFIPVRNCTVNEADEIAKQVSATIVEKLGVPSFLCEKSVSVPHRENLSEIRRGQFEGIPEKMEGPKWKPDFGPDHIHLAADVTATGARMPLATFSINLDTPNLEIASQITRKVRFIGGGFRSVKAIGVMLKGRNIAQVSMNLTDYTRSVVHRIFETVKMEARRYGVNVVGSEVIDLVPMAALIDCAKYCLQIENLSMEQVLEIRLWTINFGGNTPVETKDMTLEAFCATTISNEPASGGGSVSALVGALVAALTEMIAQLTIGKKGYEEITDEMKTIIPEAVALRAEFLDEITRDSTSSGAYTETTTLPRDTDEQKGVRHNVVQGTLKKVAEMPLHVAAAAAKIMLMAGATVKKRNANAITNGMVVTMMTRTATLGALPNAKINLGSIRDEAYVADTKTKTHGIGTAIVRDEAAILAAPPLR